MDNIATIEECCKMIKAQNRLLAKYIENDEHLFIVTLNKLADRILELSEGYNSGWISCNDRLPDTDRDVLISVKCKLDGELDIAISSWVDARFGGHSLGYKEWSKPWDCFHSNYEVLAWRELPKPFVDDIKTGNYSFAEIAERIEEI